MTRTSFTTAAALVTTLALGLLALHSTSSWSASSARVLLEPFGIHGSDDGTVNEDDGVLPDGVRVFDGRYPGLVNLDADLLRALRDAATDAADDGIELHVASGWRSAEYQDQLLREAVTTYGSEEEAARWVATAQTSPHATGDAVDIGPYDAIDWLSRYGDAYGLCQIYLNEPWHFELRPGAADDGCPRMYIDPTDDPRMQG